MALARNPNSRRSRFLSLLLACSALYSCQAILGIEDPPEGGDDSGATGGGGGEDQGGGGTTSGGTGGTTGGTSSGGTSSGGTSSGGSGDGGTSTVTGGSSGDAGQGGSAGTGEPSPDGTACSNDTTCASGFCRDGVCCESECDGACEACAEMFTGQPDGSCEPASSGLDPHDDCDEAAPDTCGDDGSCDGAGECRKYGPNQICEAAGCSSTQFQPERTCDGEGACAPAAPVECGEHPCTQTGCQTPCMGDNDCDSQSYCSSTMVCRVKKTDGTTCDAGNECRSTYCVDGVCCDGGCTGSCAACTEEKTGQASGRCLAIPTGQDPDNDCSVETGNACGRDGTCNGGNGCRVQSSGTTCGTASCSGETLTPAGTCDGQSGCTPSSARACPGSLRCASSTACLTQCATNTDCAAGNYCSNSACVPKKGTGVSCGGAAECVSGACVDSVCCGSACSLACQGCSNAATGRPNGTCGQRTAGATTACPTTNPTACFNLQTSATNCGSCGNTCQGTPSVPGTAPACLAGACASNCTNADRQICHADTSACVQSFWNFAGGDKGFWNNTNETSSEVATNHGRNDNYSLRLYASFNTQYPAEAYTDFCFGSSNGTVYVRGKSASAYVYIQATSYGSYAARCRIIAYQQDFTRINLPWTNTPMLNTWVLLTGSFGDQDVSIMQLGVVCDLPPSWNDGSGTNLERWYIDDIRITN